MVVLLAALLGLINSSMVTASVKVQVVTLDGEPVDGAVVFLESAAAKASLTVAENRMIVQRDKMFSPQITIIPTGTAINFPNEDTVRHHVYSFSAAKQFEIKLYIGTPAEPVVFDKSGVAVLGCNIHDHMIAWVLVLDTPYYASTDSSGWVTLPQIPADTYSMRVWHKDLLNDTDIPNITIQVNAGDVVNQRVIMPQLIPLY